MNFFTFANIQGLKPKTVASKVPYINDLLTTNQQLFVGLSETWLSDHIDAELHVPNYVLFRADRNRTRQTVRGRDSEGVCAYVRQDLASSMEMLLSFSNGVVEILTLILNL